MIDMHDNSHHTHPMPDVQVDLAKQTVRTLAGNGSKADGDYVGGQRGAAQLLNSPWDLAFDAEVTSTVSSPLFVEQMQNMNEAVEKSALPALKSTSPQDLCRSAIA